MQNNLTGEQFDKLQNALLSAFTTPTKLKIMVRIGLGKNLHDISSIQNLTEAIFDLITWAECHGQLEKLLTAARNERGGNPGNDLLRSVYEELELLPQQTRLKQPLQNIIQQDGEIVTSCLNPWKFDLEEFIRDCKRELLKEENKQGLVGIAVPYDVAAFSKCVCQRLKEKLGDNNIPNIGEPVKLEYKITNINSLVKNIKKYENNLKFSDIIVPVQIDSSKRISKEMAASFWQLICEEFADNIKKRLIIIMFCNKRTYFPRHEKVVILNPPRYFTIVDLDDWLINVTDALNWQHIKAQWQDKIIKECYDNDITRLEIQSVYLHLQRVLPILQERHNRNLTPEAFINLL
ncbi:effector-associated domain EAD1-containing protein [Nostoc sp. ATCC 53789]|uniref:effector-associated domain EAD1-containing protein n=1 Tax=Nostoc sp. ATCC 53789 TaxID=76335 RepID=UPI000DECBC81|nr:effector-associated domain EAD1-containing protein [Nostoc sp. ATCC 53789]QHG21213.1 hypothetical protein GJB62_35780 [Nostoc sp. ATCC 53789]RCJ16893.1 hypothetical protein A6V25_29860 [Nostoc sp. ATCC 53789]